MTISAENQAVLSSEKAYDKRWINDLNTTGRKGRKVDKSIYFTTDVSNYAAVTGYQ